MELLYSTGIRRLEIVQLQGGDLDARRRLLLVREGKGGKDRYVPVGERALYWIARYLDEAREKLALPGVLNLFVSDYGDQLNDGVLSVWVKRHMERAGVKKAGSCHLFRHAMATHMLENGADVRYIQVLLGHADITSTEIYTRVSITKLREIHAATHPARLERAGRDQHTAARAGIKDDAQAVLDALATDSEEDTDGTTGTSGNRSGRKT